MVRSPVLALHLFGCERTKRSVLAPERHQTSISREGCRDKEGNCNILYHSLPFARICAGTHLSILAVTAFVSIVRRSLLRAFHSLVFSSTARLSSLVTHTVAGHSSACVALTLSPKERASFCAAWSEWPNAAVAAFSPSTICDQGPTVTMTQLQ